MRSLFLNPQSGAGPSISSSVVLCSFVLLVCIVMLVLVFYLCPSSVCVVPTFSGIVLFPLLYSVLPFFSLMHWLFSLFNFVIPSKCLKHFIYAASKLCSSLFFSTQAVFNRRKSHWYPVGTRLKWRYTVSLNTVTRRRKCRLCPDSNSDLPVHSQWLYWRSCRLVIYYWDRFQDLFDVWINSVPLPGEWESWW